MDLITGEKLAVHDHERFWSVVPAKSDEAPNHIRGVEQDSDALLAELNAELGTTFTPSPLADFPGFVQWNQTLSNSPVRASSRHPQEFLAVTGQRAHYLLEAPTVAACAAHGWGALRASGMQYGAGLILRSSVEPASYFADGEMYHCAHRTVHDRRERTCFIASFESFLCCRACIYQERWWSTAKLAALPCGLTV